MKKIFLNFKKLQTTISGLILIISALFYQFKHGGDWEYTLEAILLGIGLIFAPNVANDEQVKKLKDIFKKQKKGLIIAFLICFTFVANAQLSKNFDTLRVKTIKALNTGSKNDSTLNFIYDDYANSESIITVNDTTLRSWVGNISGGGGGGSSDSSWTSIQVDTIKTFNGTGIQFNGNLFPAINNSYDLGTTSLAFKNVYTSGFIQNPSGGVGVEIRDNLQPDVNNSYDLGTSSLQWDDLFLSGTIQNASGGVGIEFLTVTTDAITNGAGGVLIENVQMIEQSSGVAQIDVSGGSTLKFGDNLEPSFNASNTFGNTSKRWSEIWTNSLKIGTGTVNEGSLVTTGLTSDQTYTFQNASGTVAFLSDVSVYGGSDITFNGFSTAIITDDTIIYQLVGNVVTCFIHANIAANGVGNDVRIDNLPYTSLNTPYTTFPYGQGRYADAVSASTPAQLRVTSNSTTGILLEEDNATAVLYSDIDGVLDITLTYIIDN